MFRIERGRLPYFKLSLGNVDAVDTGATLTIVFRYILKMRYGHLDPRPIGRGKRSIML